MKSAASTTTSYGTVEVLTSGYTYEFRVDGKIRAAGTLAKPPQSVVINDLHLDLDTKRLTVGDQEVRLGPAEWDILATLASDPTRPFTARELPACSLRDRIHSLRRKLGPSYLPPNTGKGWSLLG